MKYLLHVHKTNRPDRPKDIARARQTEDRNGKASSKAGLPQHLPPPRPSPGMLRAGCGRGCGRGCLVRRVVPQPVSANHLLKHRRRGSCGSTTIRPLNNARTWLSSIIFSSRITQECNVASPLTTGSVYYALSNI